MIIITRALLRNGLRDPIRLQRTFVLSASKAPLLCFALLHLVIAKEIQLDVHAPFQQKTALFMATFAHRNELVSLLLKVCATQQKQNTLVSLEVAQVELKQTYAQKLQGIEQKRKDVKYRLSVITEPWCNSFHRKCYLNCGDHDNFSWNDIERPQEEETEYLQRPIDACITMLPDYSGTGGIKEVMSCLLALLGFCNENDDGLSLDMELHEWWQGRCFSITTRERLCRWYKDEMAEVNSAWYPNQAKERRLSQKRWDSITNTLKEIRERSTVEREAVRCVVSETVCSGITGIASIMCDYVFCPFVHVC
jgi:hypothetical protein